MTDVTGQDKVTGQDFFFFLVPLLLSTNKLFGHTDDSILVAVVPSPRERVTVSESMNRDLNRVSVWCNLWGMKLNESKTMIVSRSRKIHPQLTPSTLDELC